MEASVLTIREKVGYVEKEKTRMDTRPEGVTTNSWYSIYIDTYRNDFRWKTVEHVTVYSPALSSLRA